MGETKHRSVTAVVPAHRQLEGGGFPVRRPIPTAGLAQVDPFLLLDEMGPVEWKPGEAIGAPDHPHRGFETVTYVLAGHLEHKDSSGHASRLEPGDVQWMTAGSGLVHSEMPQVDFKRSGGLMHGFQIWVNLPRANKMAPPRYQDIPCHDLPVVEADDGAVRVKVIAGEALGASAVIDTHTPIMYLHFTLQPGAEVVQPVPHDYNAFVYVFRGGALVAGDTTVEDGHIAELGRDGEAIRIACADDAPRAADLILLAGVPINEPVVRHGPFVMNTKQEIVEAIYDYQAGRMGKIDV
jgi:redox-sensitive bicupin YhaK (pirin superfamily)